MARRDPVIITAMLCIVALEGVALYLGRDGIFFAGVISAVMALAGVRFGFPKA